MATHDYNADSASDRAPPPLGLPPLAARRYSGFVLRPHAPPGGLAGLPLAPSNQVH
jgi:hypothetical protein